MQSFFLCREMKLRCGVCCVRRVYTFAVSVIRLGLSKKRCFDKILYTLGVLLLTTTPGWIRLLLTAITKHLLTPPPPPFYFFVYSQIIFFATTCESNGIGECKRVVVKCKKFQWNFKLKMKRPRVVKNFKKCKKNARNLRKTIRVYIYDLKNNMDSFQNGP